MKESKYIEEIKADRKRGARELTLVAMDGLLDCINSYPSDNEVELRRYFVSSAKAIALARPSMASITTSMITIVYEVLKLITSRNLRELILNAIVEQQIRFRKAYINTASNAAKLLNKRTMISCSYSSNVIQAIRQAVLSNTSLRVMLLKSPSIDGLIDYGSLMRESLNDAGVNANLIDDIDVVKSVDIAIVGADSIFPDEIIVNGSPTFMLAIKALKYGKPFYVVSETWKINPLSLNLKSVDDGMDLIPFQLVNSVVTEFGRLDQKDIRLFANEFSKRLTAIKNVWN